MKFEDYTSCAPNYAKWLVSENKAFFIGVLNYLFGQKCIQVLFKETAESQDQYVIQEWRTYKPELVETLIQKIKDNLANVEAGFGDWGLVEKFLPEKRAKYLEDESDEEERLVAKG